MAIIAPADLPVVLKVRSDPMKKYVISQLGYPGVDVEITEDQFEIALRVTGDFIAGYFPREQKFAFFQTQPLVATYPMPTDAYWIQEVAWDPVTTRIDDVFGAESFLFCLAPDFKVLDKDGSLQNLGDWRKAWKAKTPFGNKKLDIVKRDNKRLLPKVRIEYDGGIIEATNNHVLKVNNRWREFGEATNNDMLYNLNDTGSAVSKITTFESSDALSVRAIGSGCYFGCSEGEPVLVH